MEESSLLQRPSKEMYALLIALAVRTRADCIGRHVGAVLMRDCRVISTGYNGTPFGLQNCSDGGCYRCQQRRAGNAPRGGAYDVCICVHAEQNALLTAARFGQQTIGSTMTTTTQPCFGCLKEMLQAGVEEVRYLHPWDPGEAHGQAYLEQYKLLTSHFKEFQQIGDSSLDSDDLFASFLQPL